MLIAKGIEREKERERDVYADKWIQAHAELSVQLMRLKRRISKRKKRKRWGWVEVKTALAAWFIRRVTFNLGKKTMHIKMQNRLLQ